MRAYLVLTAFVLVYQPCTSRSLNEEDSVVSVYTTLPSTGGGGSAPLDVYRQIADNIAEKITQPFYRFFGLTNSTTEEKTTTNRPFEHIELDSTELTSPARTGKNDTKPTKPDRDVEELSIDSFRKSDKKPEKITLFSSYLPVKQNFELNDTKVEKDDNSLELDDVDADSESNDDDNQTGRVYFVYFLELVGSIIQLLWGGFLTIFKPSTNE